MGNCQCVRKFVDATGIDDGTGTEAVTVSPGGHTIVDGHAGGALHRSGSTRKIDVTRSVRSAKYDGVTINQPGKELRAGDEIKVYIAMDQITMDNEKNWFYCKVVSAAIRGKRPVMFGKPRDLARKLARFELEKIMAVSSGELARTILPTLPPDTFYDWSINAIDAIESYSNRYDSVPYREYITRLKERSKVMIPLPATTRRGTASFVPFSSSIENGLLEFDRIAGDHAADLARVFAKVYTDQMADLIGCGMIGGKDRMDPEYCIVPDALAMNVGPILESLTDGESDCGGFVYGMGHPILLQEASLFGINDEQKLEGRIGSMYRILSIARL